MKKMMFLFKGVDNADELEDLMKHFSEGELDAILQSIKIPSGTIDTLIDAFKYELKRRIKKKHGK